MILIRIGTNLYTEQRFICMSLLNQHNKIWEGSANTFRSTHISFHDKIHFECRVCYPVEIIPQESFRWRYLVWLIYMINRHFFKIWIDFLCIMIYGVIMKVRFCLQRYAYFINYSKSLFYNVLALILSWSQTIYFLSGSHPRVEMANYWRSSIPVIGSMSLCLVPFSQ